MRAAFTALEPPGLSHEVARVRVEGPTGESTWRREGDTVRVGDRKADRGCRTCLGAHSVASGTKQHPEGQRRCQSGSRQAANEATGGRGGAVVRPLRGSKTRRGVPPSPRAPRSDIGRRWPRLLPRAGSAGERARGFPRDKSPPEPRGFLLLTSACAPRWLVSCTGTMSEDVCRRIWHVAHTRSFSALQLRRKMKRVGTRTCSSRRTRICAQQGAQRAPRSGFYFRKR